MNLWLKVEIIENLQQKLQIAVLKIIGTIYSHYTTNYSLCCHQLRLEALCQMSSFLSKMEEKSSGFTVSPQFPALLQSVQLQFLSGCFALGTQIIGSHSGNNYEMQHYMVQIMITLS